MNYKQVNNHLLRRWLEKSDKVLLKLNIQNRLTQKVKKYYRHSQIYMTTFKEGGFLSLNKKQVEDLKVEIENLKSLIYSSSKK